MRQSKCSDKIKNDYDELAKIVEALRVLGKEIVCTIGTWDLLHIGHLRYLEHAKNQGDILIVGVDSDKGVKLYKKNPLRPVIPQKERMEMLSYQGFVDYVTLIDDVDENGIWQFGLIKKIKPDIFVAANVKSYPPEQLEQIKDYCGRLAILSYEAKETSSSKIIEETFKKRLEYILDKFNHF